MRRLIKSIVVIAVVTISITSIINKVEAYDTNSSRRYESTNFNFVFRYPSEWEDYTVESSVVYPSPYEKIMFNEAGKGFFVNFNMQNPYVSDPELNIVNESTVTNLSGKEFKMTIYEDRDVVVGGEIRTRVFMSASSTDQMVQFTSKNIYFINTVTQNAIKNNTRILDINDKLTYMVQTSSYRLPVEGLTKILTYEDEIITFQYSSDMGNIERQDNLHPTTGIPFYSYTFTNSVFNFTVNPGDGGYAADYKEDPIFVRDIEIENQYGNAIEGSIYKYLSETDNNFKAEVFINDVNLSANEPRKIFSRSVINWDDPKKVELFRQVNLFLRTVDFL